MADTKISALTPISSSGQNPDKLWIPLYAEDGSPLNVRVTASELFRTPFSVTAGAYRISPSAIVNDAGTSRTLSASDNGKTLVFSSNSNVNVTVPSGLGVGYTVSAIKTGSGNLTYVASSTTLQAPGGDLTASGQYSVSSILAIATDTFNVLVGGPVATGVGSSLSDGDYGDIIVGSSATSFTFDTGVVTTFSRTLLDDTGVAQWRTTLGLGSAALNSSADFAADIHTHNGADITAGIVPVAHLGSGTLNANTFLNGLGTFTAVTGAGGGLIDGNYTDITASASGTVLTVNSGIVTYGKLQTLAGNTLVGRSGTSGVAQAISISNYGLNFIAVTGAAQALSSVGGAAASHVHSTADITTGIFNVARLGSGTLNANTFLNGLGAFTTTSGGSGGLADGNYTDITVSATSTVLTINSGVVTYGKMQQIAPETLIGRSGLTSGVAHAIPISSFGRTLITAADAADARTDLGFSETDIGSFGLQLLESTGASQALALISGAPLVHTHDASAITSGIINVARLGSGTLNANTFLNGLGQFTTTSGGGGVANGVYNQITVVGANDWQVSSNANLLLGAVRATGNLGWFQKTQLSSATDGVLLVTNSGGTDFTCMQFGGATDSFPSIRKSGIELVFETAAGASNIPIRVSGVTSNVYKTNLNNFINSTGIAYTIASVDNGKTFVSSSDSAVTLTVASGLDIGFSFSIIQEGSGVITVSGAAGVTLHSYSNLYATAGQYATASLLSVASNVYSLAGALA